MQQDEALCNLVENLRETVALANVCPNLKKIEGTVDVIKEIGSLTIDISCFIDRYARSSFSGLLLLSIFLHTYLSLCEFCKVVRLNN